VLKWRSRKCIIGFPSFVKLRCSYMLRCNFFRFDLNRKKNPEVILICGLACISIHCPLKIFYIRHFFRSFHNRNRCILLRSLKCISMIDTHCLYSEEISDFLLNFLYKHSGIVSVQYLFLSHTAMNKTETFSETALSLSLKNTPVPIKKKWAKVVIDLITFSRCTIPKVSVQRFCK